MNPGFLASRSFNDSRVIPAQRAAAVNEISSVSPPQRTQRGERPDRRVERTRRHVWE